MSDSDSDSDSGGANYSNEGRNYATPTGSPAGESQSEGGGWSGGGFSSSSSSDRVNLSADAGLANAAWGSMTPDEKAAINAHLGRPQDYNPIDRSWRDVAFDFTNPDYNSTAYRLGIRGIGTTDVQRQEATNPGMQQERMDAVGSVIERLGLMAIQAMPGGGLALSAARAYNAYDHGMPAKDAIMAGLFDFGGGWAASKINKEAVGALGPEVGKALSQYNSLASLANIGGAGVPTFNPGGMAVSAAAKELGVKSISSPTGATNIDGTSVQGNYSGGGFSGSRSSSTNAVQQPIEEVLPVAAVTPQEQAQINPWSFDGAAFGKRLKAGVDTRYGGVK